MRLKIKKTGSFKQSKKYIDLINQATVYDTAIKTPITFAKNISKKLANKSKIIVSSKHKMGFMIIVYKTIAGGILCNT